MCNWIGILSALLTPVIAIIGSVIAWQQYQTNKRRLKHELFDRRFKVYDIAKYLLGQIYSNRILTDQQLYTFRLETRESLFLFDEDIDNYFKIWAEKSYYAKALHDELESHPIGADRSESVRKQREIFDWFESQQEILVKKFIPYLQLKH